MARISWILVATLCLLLFTPSRVSRGAEPQTKLLLRITWGYRSPARAPFHVRFEGDGIALSDVKSIGLEAGEGLREGAWQTTAGATDVDGVELVLRCPDVTVNDLKPLHPIWRDLILQSDPDTALRLRNDPGFRRDARQLTVLLSPGGDRGFSVTVDQMLRNRALWVPSLDVYLAIGSSPFPLSAHLAELEGRKGKRILEQVHHGPEASYDEFKSRWEDMGSPAYRHPAQPAPGHIVGLTWDSAIPKFGVDRDAGVWNDLGNPDQFRLAYSFGDVADDLAHRWKGQSLLDGLPVLRTTIEKNGVRYEVEQFAYPLDGPPRDRQGNVAMVLLQKVRLVNLDALPRTVPLWVTHQRESAAFAPAPYALVADPMADCLVLERSGSHEVLLTVQGNGASHGTLELRNEELGKGRENTPKGKTARLQWMIELPGSGARDLVFKLPSPIVTSEDRNRLLALVASAARERTIRFWSEELARGARFKAPEKVVNDLFRANLWHALRLPRRHGGSGPGVKIDLPYSNFAYAQHGTPWPVNQAVYVDTMIYDQRGYHELANEELLSIYHNNQEPDGHVGGFARWGAYTPGMIDAAAHHYLLSDDRAAFERLLPPTLKALDWCLGEVRKTSNQAGTAAGLVRAPLNDGTGEGFWAFNQAYVYAGFRNLGEALDRYGHPRARECLEAARAFRSSVERAFAVATVHAPLVQLRDHTWSPYVPCEVLTPRRLTEQWYPTDVDTGAVHLLRLGALPARGNMADALLNDHEDNLFLKGWGMANEPVYNQQATAYLLRDDPEAAIRAFYSGLACAFSHSALEPVEHRWTWGQYYGPPSTDGSWFDLYRHMLIHERDDRSLLLFQATPRQWLEDGQRIEVGDAPTEYGTLSMTLESEVKAGQIAAEISMPTRRSPRVLLVRFRHPARRAIRSATVNDQRWLQFDAEREWVRIESPGARHYRIVAHY